MMIYLDVFAIGVHHLTTVPHDWMSGPKLKASIDVPYYLALVETCREIHDEAELVPYKHNIFDFGNPMNVQLLLNTITNSVHRDAMRSISFSINVCHPKGITSFLKEVDRLGIWGLNKIFANVHTIIVHTDLRLQRRGIRSGWEHKIAQAGAVFDEWDNGGLFQAWQQFLDSTGPSGNARLEWKGASNATGPNPNIRIIFHVILIDGRHYDRTTFLAGPVNETVRPTVRGGGVVCELEH